MQIKRFEAKNMTTALRMIKGELGPEAVILSARSLRKGKGFFGSMKYAGVEVTAAIDIREAQNKTGNSVSTNTTRTKMLNSQSNYGNQAPEPDNNWSGDYPTYGRTNQKIHPRINKVDSRNHRALSLLYQQMLAQAVDRHIASELIDEIKRIPASQDLVTSGDLNAHLKSILEEMGVWVDKNAFSKVKPHIVALIGTTGVGKTTTIAKLAAVQTNRRKKRVAVITIDNYGIAANEQLKRYARIIGVPLETAVNNTELKWAIKKFKQKDLILIDTPGISPNNLSQIRELKSYFTKLPELQRHLVVSVATKEKDLSEIFQAFKEVGVQRLLFSKIDESNTYGNMLNVLIRTNIPLSFLSCGRKVPDDIEVGSVQKLVDLIFQIKDLDRKPLTDSSILKANGSGQVHESSIKRSYFVANKNSDVYHHTDCKWSKKIKPENIVQFASNREAETQNFLPCRSCNPERLNSDDTKDLRTAARKFSSYQ
ncbi:Flagellar biosynthesis protein FlhF [Olavius sp. associated proteobacterium Delta 1]|nr:Flagellar biosynthesis protein FlhF [Olavius sp. associated proteobacterium Delta 1]